MTTLSKDFSYFSKINISSITEYQACLEKYSKNFNQEVQLKTNTALFLDTNVLLRYYSISFTARKKLFGFIEANKDRIIISSQVQQEFIRNREDVIQRFFEQVTNKIPKEFQSELLNKMNNFLDQHKIVLKDYPFVETEIKKYKSDSEMLLKKLNETIGKKKEEHHQLLVNDELLNLLSNCILNPPLSLEELNMIKTDFDNLKKSVGTENIDSMLNKPYTVFPGAGDIKLKPESPYGDFIIYHEILKYMATKHNDVAFLTFDNTKGDWMSRNKAPHLHYIQNAFLNTGHILYVIDAERSLENLLDVNIESLVSVSLDNDEVNAETLFDLSRDTPLCEGKIIVSFPDWLVKEIQSNGYNSIKEVKKDVNRASIAIKHYSAFEDLNNAGTVRVALHIANPNYQLFLNKNGSIHQPQASTLKEYEECRKFLTQN